MVLLFYVFAVALVEVKQYPPLSSNVLKPESKKRTGNLKPKPKTKKKIYQREANSKGNNVCAYLNVR